MSSSQRRIAATLVAAALIVAAVTLVWGGNNPVSAFIAEVTGTDVDGGAAFGPPVRPTDGSAQGSGDSVRWDADDGDDTDAIAFGDPAVRALRIRLSSPEQSAVGGIPVVVLGKGENGPVLAGPKYT